MKTKNCLECKREFEPQRASTKFCSLTCRVKYQREEMKKFYDSIGDMTP